jgi:hypothetical protein
MRSLFRVTDWERVSLWRRLLAALVRVTVLIVLLNVLIVVFGPPIGISLTARQEAKRFPGVKVTPQRLPDYTTPDVPGTTLSYFGYSFEVPWNSSFKQKAFGKSGLVQLEFASGQSVTFIVPANQGGLLTEIVRDKSLHMENMGLIFGDLMKRSPYDQYAALLNTTPLSIRAFGPRAEAVRGTTLLTIKAITVGPGLETGVFAFEFPDKRGFQIGDPLKSRRMDLEIFDVEGHHVEVICATTKDSVRLSQRELNRILKSFHLVLAGSDKP